MSDNQFTEAMDDAAEEQTDPLEGFDVEAFLSELNEGPKNETIGVAVTEEMHAFWRELRESDDVDIDVTESIRNHLEDLATRHPQAAERAGRKLEIDREL